MLSRAWAGALRAMALPRQAPTAIASAGAPCLGWRRQLSSSNAEFAYVGRKPGKVHYYKAFNEHLQELDLYKDGDDRKWERAVRKREAKPRWGADTKLVIRMSEKKIRVSPLKLNLVCKLVRGLPVRDAVAQLTFSKKKHARTMLQLLSDACRDARERYQLLPDQLELQQIFCTSGGQQKRMRIMGKGHTGIGYKRYSHLNVILQEIDFAEKVANSRTEKDAHRWMKLKLQAQATIEKEGINYGCRAVRRAARRQSPSAEATEPEAN